MLSILNKKRTSNLELLRIISVLLIISFHYVFKGNFIFDQFTLNNFLLKIFYFFGELGVNLFLLITGYFMCKSNFKPKKLLLLLLEVLFYYLFSITLSYFLGTYQYSGIKNTVLLLFPTILNKYWFVTAYILLYILSPYLNKFIQSITKKDYLKFICLVLILWSIIPTVFGIFYNSTEKMLYYNRFIWAIIIYFIGAYIRMYSPKIINSIKKSAIISTISLSTMIFGILIIEKFGSFFEKLGTTESAYFWPPNTIPMVLLSIGVFSIFTKISIPNNKFINLFASTSLGVYLLHDGPLNSFLWNEVFKNASHQNSPYLILYILGATIIIFIICSLIDLIRQIIENKLIIKIFDSKIYNLINKKITKIANNFLQYLN